MLAAKLDPALNVVTARQGVADLETLMPMLFSDVVAGRISVDRFVELTSGNAARLFGLHPRKGAVTVGTDADLVLKSPAHHGSFAGTKAHKSGAKKVATPIRSGLSAIPSRATTLAVPPFSGFRTR
jgi:dihydroorotase-like cyclic amidohydrolase